MKSLDLAAATLVATGPEKRILSGECETSKLAFLEAAELRFGVWQCTAGSWSSSWDTWEYFTVISGRGTLVDQHGGVHVLAPGVVVMIPAGSRGVWNLDEPLRKSYVAPVKRDA